MGSLSIYLCPSLAHQGQADPQGKVQAFLCLWPLQRWPWLWVGTLGMALFLPRHKKVLWKQLSILTISSPVCPTEEGAPLSKAKGGHSSSENLL